MSEGGIRKKGRFLQQNRSGFIFDDDTDTPDEEVNVKAALRTAKSSRLPLVDLGDYDYPAAPVPTTSSSYAYGTNEGDIDPLDAFIADMHTTHADELNQDDEDDVYSMLAAPMSRKANPFGSNFVTAEDLQKNKSSKAGWESDTTGVSAAEDSETEDDEREEEKKSKFMDALKSHTASLELASNAGGDSAGSSKKAGAGKDALGIMYRDDGDVIDEQFLNEKSALELLEEHKRGKEMKQVDHASISYLPFRKNLYIVPRVLAKLNEDELQLMRDELDVKVRGHGCPAPVQTWDQCGLSERILQVLDKYDLKTPYAIQQQAIPAIMAGRDIIGVAKTGSGKTLAFLLPMFRHILDQPPLQPGDGPVGLIMAPARELAFQIHNEAKKFTKALGLRASVIYGGTGVAEQIGDLKRQPHIVVCTPGRMIDILCMHAGRLLSLQRVTMVVMDEADRMFDMGFEPQIQMIMKNIRLDRQTILFSATFPKQIEKLAKAVLTLPLEIQVGEKSTVNTDITQVVEVHEEGDKFLRLLQLLGVWYDKGNVLIFVDKQEKCDQLFADLLRAGYPCLSLHGGKDQVDREHTLREFKTLVKTVMVATGVAGRGLDVPEIKCVVNYHCPNHLEDYVHRVGRTGRAGRKGTAYTFISQAEEAYAPIMVKVLSLVNKSIPPELNALCSSFKAKVKAGNAKWTNSGFEGKGFTFDATEMNEAQKQSSQQKKAYEVEMGIIPDADKDALTADDDVAVAGDAAVATSGGERDEPSTAASAITNSKLGAYSQAIQAALDIFRAKSTHTIRSVQHSRLFISAPIIKADGSLDVKAAVARAKLIGAEIADERARSGSNELLLGQKGGEAYFVENLDINDYPPQARAKVTQAGRGLDRVMELLGVNVVSKGAYVPPGKKRDDENPGLQLVIEGNTSMIVKKAKAEIVRMLDSETRGISSVGSSQASQGRYSVLAIGN